MSELLKLHVIVYGHVQGVYFRAFVEEKAIELGLKGYVRNLRNVEAVEVEAEGEKDKLEQLLSHVKIGPPYSRVDKANVAWSAYTGIYDDFRITG